MVGGAARPDRARTAPGKNATVTSCGGQVTSERAEKSAGPHQGQPVLMTGESLDKATAAMVMLHGRGATAEDILELAAEFKQPGFAYIAPQAARNSWSPNSFLAPIPSNEPGLSSGLAVIATILAQLAEAGIPAERTMLLGFSQGACLALEFAARNARCYGGLVGLSGALIGPDDTPRNYGGSLGGTPLFLCRRHNHFHLSRERVMQSPERFKRPGGHVTAN